jgi:outer membrane protein
MIRRTFVPALTVLLWAAPVLAQSPLSLPEAIARAQAHNPDARRAELAEREAAARLDQARAGYLPSIDAVESWQRSNQPVFVFGALLTQRRFTADRFAVEALNHPGAVNNLRLGVSVDQAVFDPSRRAGVRGATLGREMAAAARELVAQDLAAAVTQLYGAVLAADAATRAASAAIDSATADLALAQNRRDAGAATEADVLRVQVHLAQAREQRIRRGADVTIARARLNQALGEPLDASFTLDATPAPAALAPGDTASLERTAIAARPDLAMASLQERFASTAVDAARAGLFGTRASSWMVGAVARVNLFRGFADRARLSEARLAQSSRAIDREKTETAVRLDVRIALARLEAARAADDVSRVAVDQARESHRIVRDRYENGLADVAALVSAAEAVQLADARQSAARVDVTVAAATLTRALGQR